MPRFMTLVRVRSDYGNRATLTRFVSGVCAGDHCTSLVDDPSALIPAPECEHSFCQSCHDSLGAPSYSPCPLCSYGDRLQEVRVEPDPTHGLTPEQVFEEAIPGDPDLLVAVPR